MNAEGNREWKHWTYRSRTQARIFETIDDETRKKSNNRFSTLKLNASVLKFEGPLPQSGVVTQVYRGLEFEGSLPLSGIMR